MRSALVIRGGPLFPDWTKAERPEYAIERFLWEAADPGLSQSMLDAVRARTNPATGETYKVGIMRVPGWDQPPLSPQQLALKLSDDLGRLASPSRGSGLKQCDVLVDFEGHDSQYLIDFLTFWRDPAGANRPSRATGWTMEGFQFSPGWVTDDLVAKVNADVNLTLHPQPYDSGMLPFHDSAVALELCRRGVQAKRVSNFLTSIARNTLGYPTRVKPPARWDGILFDWINWP